MKVVVFETEPWEEGCFRTACSEHDLVFVGEPLSPANVGEYADAGVISTFIYSELSREVLSSFENLKLIATRSTGYDHIDTDYCDEQGILVSNVPTYGESTVAEHVFALILALLRKIPEAVDRTRKGDFSMQGLRGRDLRGKTLGVIGTGAIGRHVIEMAKGFSMEVLAFDVRPDESFALDLGFSYVGQDRLLKESDIITVHVPGGPRTKNLLAESEFEIVKRGCVVINTSRGSVVKTSALLRALSDGRVSAAGLDVLDEEPTIREEAELIRSVFRKEHNLEALLVDHVLMHMRNVIVTPHIAFDTEEAVQRILEATAENIEGYCSGDPRNVVAGEGPS